MSTLDDDIRHNIQIERDLDEGYGRNKCGICDFYIWHRSKEDSPGCLKDWNRTTNYNDSSCEKYQCTRITQKVISSLSDVKRRNE